MTAMSIDDRLALVRETMKAGPPVTSGVHPVNPKDLVVYYDVDERSNRIDLGNATMQDLVAFHNAYQTNNDNTMDTTKFATRLDVVASGLLDSIALNVLQGENADGNKSLKARLARLDIYGPGESINSHREPPQGNYVIGSLVVVFPTTHVGGRVSVQHQEASSSFDPASELATTSTPAIWYMALYGDIPYMVESLLGYRVTLTYNLFLIDPNVPAALSSTPSATERRLEQALLALLADATFLPAGGFLAAGLAHAYPIPRDPADVYDPDAHYEGHVLVRSSKPEQRWGTVVRALKGSDARLRDVSTRIGLAPFVRPLYAPASAAEWEDDCDVLVNDIPDLFGVHEGLVEMGLGLTAAELRESSAMGCIIAAGTVLQRDVTRVEELQWMRVGRYPQSHNIPPTPHGEVEKQISLSQRPGAVAVHWLSQLGEQNRMRTAYIRSDNMVAHACGTAALFIRVPAIGEGIRSS
ncbi:hypothetical protein C8R47DRAFT_1102447 [Mycena vitilis]|nr:hypothetical protein C8R47DRAFT_1102447 [Mycena vitilis]